MSAIAVLHREVPPDAARPGRMRPGAGWRCTIVRVEGELDAAVAADFRVALDKAVATSSYAVVVDLRRTRFLSIGAARLLVDAKSEAAAAGMDLRVVAGRRDIERILEVTGLRPLFRYYSSIPAAVHAQR
jgi:anti-anti-sigma factor